MENDEAFLESATRKRFRFFDKRGILIVIHGATNCLDLAQPETEVSGFGPSAVGLRRSAKMI
jgi:hypothetical protein